MILQFNKSLNSVNEYSLIKIDNNNTIVDIRHFNGNNSIYETPEHYYYYSNKIINLGDYEKFKILAKKGDIVSLTARDNSYLVFPSKKTFAIAFNLKYHEVLQYKYEEVLIDGKPYQVKYVKDKDKINDGVVYSLKQLCTYISSLIKGNNYYKLIDIIKTNDPNDKIKRVITKYYDTNNNFKFNKKYELNIKKVWQDDQGKWNSITFENYTKSNVYMYDWYLIRMFAYMILSKSLNDEESYNDPMYRFNRKFNSIDEVFDFLNENQDIVNNFFIETNTLFNSPNDMCSGYATKINGVYMYYTYNNVKTYIYRNIDKQYFNDKLLKQTYVSNKYRHKIKGIKNIYVIE